MSITLEQASNTVVGVANALPDGYVIKNKLNEAIAISHDLGQVLGMKTSNPGEILGKLKIAATDTKEAFVGLSNAVHSKNIDEVVKQTDKIATRLENNELTGKEVKSILASVGKLVSAISKIALDVSSFNFVGLPIDIATALVDLKDSIQALKYGFQKFVKFYNEKIKPELHNIKIKVIEPLEKKIKKVFTKKDTADKALKQKDGSNDHHKVKDFFKKVSDKFDHVFHKDKSKSKDVASQDHKDLSNNDVATGTDVKVTEVTIAHTVDAAELVHALDQDNFAIELI
ncbi:MAG: hypothetical protein ACK5WS_01135 [Alphaproteobacteria bacterium]|jgi:hypothetical protein|nr:hypothetical protein [Candidatus Jidaibacter sp.]